MSENKLPTPVTPLEGQLGLPDGLGSKVKEDVPKRSKLPRTALEEFLVALAGVHSMTGANLWEITVASLESAVETLARKEEARKRYPLELMKIEVEWLIRRYDQSALEAGGVGENDSVRYADARITQLKALLNPQAVIVVGNETAKANGEGQQPANIPQHPVPYPVPTSPTVDLSHDAS